MDFEFIEELKADPIFAMSLSSKELFHSNVLAWTFEKSMTDKSFDELKKLFGIPAGEKILAVFREKENFDVLVLYGSAQNPGLVLIENKFKAIPAKKQFAEYSKKLKTGFSLVLPDVDGKSIKVKTANLKRTAKFIFAPKFTLKFFYDQIKDDGWKKVSYEKYLECIEKIQPENKDDGLILSKYAKMTDTIIDGIINAVLLEKENKLNVLPDDAAVTRLSEIRMHDLYVKMWYSRALGVINRSVNAENYDYCASDLSHSEGLLDWKKMIDCGKGKLYAGVQIQNKFFRITVEPFDDKENSKEKYSFRNKNNSSEIYIKTAEWENKILEELSKQFDFLIKPKQRREPCMFKDFKYMKYDMNKDTQLSELAKAVDAALELIMKNSDSLKGLGFEFNKE